MPLRARHRLPAALLATAMVSLFALFALSRRPPVAPPGVVGGTSHSGTSTRSIPGTDGEPAGKATTSVPRFELPATAPSSSIAVLKDEGSGEGDFWHEDRVTFNRSYRAFVKDAGLTTAQEEAFRISLGETQDKLTALRARHRELRRMAIHDAIWRGQDPPKTNSREEFAEEKKLQTEMDEHAGKILTPSQSEMLRRGIDYIPIRRLPGLGSSPFETGH